jgi:hypothetical protein
MGWSAETGVGSCSRIAAMRLAWLFATKARCPVSIS